MSTRTVIIGLAIPFALLACSASAGPEAVDDQSSALTSRPLPTYCGFTGWAACTSGPACVSGDIDMGGTCVACSNIDTSLSASLQMSSDGFAEAVVRWSTTPAAPVNLWIQNTKTGAYVGSYMAYTPGSGTWTFPALFAGTTYDITASPFEPGEVPCAATASTTVTTPPSSLTLDLGASDSFGDFSKGTLTIYPDGTWYVSRAYIQLATSTTDSTWSQLICNVEPGVTWPTWALMIGFNVASDPTGNLLGSGQLSWLAADWLKIAAQDSANCQLDISTHQPWAQTEEPGDLGKTRVQVR